MLFRLCLLAIALASPLAAQTTAPAPAAKLPAPQDREALAAATKLLLARNGNEIVVAWELPAGAAIKGIDIYRNTQAATKGRARLDYVRPTPASFTDQVPDAGGDYWYWLKVALPSGEHYNVGPVKAPDAVVWTP